MQQFAQMAVDGTYGTLGTAATLGGQSVTIMDSTTGVATFGEGGEANSVQPLALIRLSEFSALGFDPRGATLAVGGVEYTVEDHREHTGMNGGATFERQLILRRK